jgi:nucleoside phosphorylase
MAQPPLKHGDYSVGWICALEIERSAARGMLDKEHPNLPLSAFDQNIYSLGSIGDHNVAIACLPEGMPGTAAAANVANFMSSTFTELRFQLLVGIGGGAPKPRGERNPRNDIRLGDIVVSRPTDEDGGVIQYDFGKAEANGEFVHKGTLRRPPLILLSAIGTMRSDERVQGLDLSKHLQRLDSFPDSDEWKHQGIENDELFAADYNHKEAKDSIITSCNDCEREHLISRLARKDTKPAVHYGLIATANQVMKDGVKREMIRSKHNILCFEMEAGGLDNFECLVIRGICDYSDTHKNDRWQPYAAATAAAYARELLFKIPKRQVSQEPPMPSVAPATGELNVNVDNS